MSWLEQKYISLLSNRLLKFKRKSPVLYNFRCPLCGDSQQNQNKARAFIYQKAGIFSFHCHNCAESFRFPKFLKMVDIGLYNQYTMESFSEKRNDIFNQPKISKNERDSTGNSALQQLKCLKILKPSHIARRYVASRLLPERFYDQLFYCDEFKAWTNSQIPDKFEDMDFDEERLVIPLFDRSGNMFGYQGRSLNPNNKIRYISIILDENRPKIWGWAAVDFNRRYWVLEGPLDAMFLSNSIATAGGKISSELLKIGCNLENSVVVYDNEPRNKDVASNVNKAVMANYNTVIWPSNLPYKDVNEMILAGYTSGAIETLMRKHTFKGLKAELEFSRWRM